MKNILIIGGAGTLRDELNHKLSREGNFVSLLTNGQKFLKKPREYLYSYESDSVHEALDSSSPDTIIFLGAHDPLFSWNMRTEQKDYKAYIAGLTNILHWAEAVGVQRFIYLSSECVFEDYYLSPINEEMTMMPRSTKAMAVSLGESMVSNYAIHHRMDTVIVRLSQLYMAPADLQECSDVYTKLCIEAATHGQVKINAKIKRSALFINDAVQALMQLTMAERHSQPLYHIAAEETVTEADAAELIQKAASRQVRIDDQTVGMEHCLLLADSYFAEEFGFKARYTLAEGIPQVMQKIQGNIRAYTESSKPDSEENKSLLSRVCTQLIPFAEALGAFILVLLAEVFLSDSSFFRHVDFFLLYVLVFALKHGMHQSILTAALSALGYFTFRMNGRNYLELLLDVGIYIWLIQIFSVGMFVGHQKDRLRQAQTDKDEEVNYLALRLGDISEINKSNVVIKNYFEQQTINSTESLGFFYEIVARLDAANANEVMFVAVQLLAKVMGTEDVAIYSVDEVGYCRLLTSMTQRASAMGKSLAMRDYRPVFEALEKEHVFINRTADDRLPVMASGIADQNGTMSFVIFLWNLPYERMTLHYSNTLRILSLLIRSAMERTTNYLDALTSKRYIKKTNILQDSAFRDVYKVYQNAQQKGLTEYTLLKVEAPRRSQSKKTEKPEKEDQDSMLELLTKTKYLQRVDTFLQDQLRQLDYVGYLNDSSFYILLVNSNCEGGHAVKRRLAEKGLAVKMVEQLPD